MSLEKYTSHLKGLCVRGELETEQNCNILTPSTLLAIIAFFSRSPGLLNRRPGGPAFTLQLIWTSCRRGYIIIWHPPTSCERHNSYSVQPVVSQGYPLISSTGCTCNLYRCISHLTARPDKRSICNNESDPNKRIGKSSTFIDRLTTLFTYFGLLSSSLFITTFRPLYAPAFFRLLECQS